MSANQSSPAKVHNLTVASGTVSGDPVLIGTALVGVAETDRDATTGKSLVRLEANQIYSVSVKGVDGSGNSAVAVGDIIYIVMADTPHLSKKATGVKFGIALETVTSGATATILVKFQP